MSEMKPLCGHEGCGQIAQHPRHDFKTLNMPMDLYNHPFQPLPEATLPELKPGPDHLKAREQELAAKTFRDHGEWSDRTPSGYPVGASRWEDRYAAAYAEHVNKELRAELDEVRNLLGEAARAVGGVSGPVHERIRVYRQEYSNQIHELEAERDTLRELLNAYRQKRAVDGGGCKPRTWDAGEHLKWDTEIDKLESRPVATKERA